MGQLNLTMLSDRLIHIYTDGACKGNPGPGGWGALLVYSKTKKELYGFSPETTNNIGILHMFNISIRNQYFSKPSVFSMNKKSLAHGWKATAI